jgi:hypothetical protein
VQIIPDTEAGRPDADLGTATIKKIASLSLKDPASLHDDFQMRALTACFLLTRLSVCEKTGRNSVIHAHFWRNFSTLSDHVAVRFHR